MTGRGAWPVSGLGGTLEYDGAGGTRPGPYYMLAAPGQARVGSGGGQSPDVNRRAVHAGIKAIQYALNREIGDELSVSGAFGPATRAATLHWQKSLPPESGVTIWGGIGQESAKYLFLPLLRTVVPTDSTFRVVFGLIDAESGWDPGAVGYYDDHDLGLGQINGPANPDLSETERLRPHRAFTYTRDRYINSLKYFHGDQRTAIASYNLGLGGAAAWKKDGSPDYWTPAGSSTPRNVKGYVDRILTAYRPT